jgi:hypothetical protein
MVCIRKKSIKRRNRVKDRPFGITEVLEKLAFGNSQVQPIEISTYIFILLFKSFSHLALFIIMLEAV